MNKKTALACVVLTILVGMAIVAVNSVKVQDWLRALGYQPAQAVADIREDLELTDEAKRIFNASRPSLEERERFNNFCNSHDEQISMLGCYGNSQIYVYNIQNEKLAGITESTMAHELLHAVWARMSEGEREELGASLWQTYQDNQDIFKNTLDIYDEENKLDELHSRVGTQIAELSGDLENHYAKYFRDQDMIVEYYDSYSATFSKASEELENIASEMKVLSDEIDAQTGEYTAKMTVWTDKVSKFNECSNTAGCFETDAEFNRQRYALISEQEDLNALYEEIDQKITEYNDLVDEHNSNVLRAQDLQNSINSNSAPSLVQKG